MGNDASKSNNGRKAVKENRSTFQNPAVQNTSMNRILPEEKQVERNFSFAQPPQNGRFKEENIMRNQKSEPKNERSKAFNELQSTSQNPYVPNASMTCTLNEGNTGIAEQKYLMAQPLQTDLFKDQNVSMMHHTLPEQTYSGVKQDIKNDVRYQAANIANTGEVNDALRFNGPGPLQGSNIPASSAKILPSKIPMPSINNVSSPKDTILSKETFLPSKVEHCYDEMSSDKPTELISKNISSMLTMTQNVDKMLVKNTHEKSPVFDQHESTSTLQELNKLSESLNGMDINKTRFKMQKSQLHSGNTTCYPLPQSSSVIQDNSVMSDLYCIKKLEDMNSFILALSSRQSISCDIQSGIEKLQKNLSDLLDKFSTGSAESSSSECSSSYVNNEMEINHDFHDDQLQTLAVKEENYQNIMHSIILESAKRGLNLDLTIYICKLCDKEMNCEDDADLHIRNVHHSSEMLSGFKWYFCKSCNLQIYGTESNYHDHNSDPCHLEVKRFKAEYANAVDDCMEEAEVSDTSVLSFSNTVTVGEKDFKLSTDRQIKKLSGFSTDEQIKLSALSRQESINVSPSEDNREPQIHGGDEVCEQQDNNETNYNVDQYLVKKLEVASTCQMKDDTASVSSTGSAKRCKVMSKIRPKGPHEILISIARGKAVSNSDPVGLFCQVCAAYQLYGPKYPNHYIDVRHIKKMNEGKKKQVKKYHCHACNIDLFGDWNIMRTHNKLPMHNESVSLKNSSVENKSECNLPKSPVEQPPKYNICGNNVDEPPKNNLSGNKIENGNIKEKPDSSLMLAQKQVQMHVKLASVHQELMKEILKRYIDEHTEDTLGFCCFICEVYFLNEDQWLTHLSRPEHGERHRVNKDSAFFAVRDCLVCQVRFICNENMLAQHEETHSHMAVKQLKARKLNRGTETDEDEESSDDWSDDEFLSDAASNVSSNNAKSNQNARTEPNSNNLNSTVTNINNSKSTQPKNTVNKKGIFLIGLTNISPVDLFRFFEVHGATKCFVNPPRKTGTVIFKELNDARHFIQMKTIEIRGINVRVLPLTEKKKKKGEIQDHPLASQVATVLSSRQALNAFVMRTHGELNEAAIAFEVESSCILSDIKSVMPSCEPYLFGSRVTGLATIISDYDIYIDHNKRSFRLDLPYAQQELVIRFLRDCFRRRDSPFKLREVILDARVPILRLLHSATNVPCDISCRSGLSVENSKLIKMYVESEPCVLWLVTALKWWLRANGLLKSTLFTSYAATWLMLFFLMGPAPLRPPFPAPGASKPPTLLGPPGVRVVRPVAELQKGCPPYSVAGWDCRFPREMPSHLRLQNRQEPLLLLVQFFQFYGNNDFKHDVLCPLTGTFVPRDLFQKLSLPRQFQVYVQRMNESNTQEKLRIGTAICLQDPFDLGHNITKGVNEKNLKKFQQLCIKSAVLCQQNLLDKDVK